MKRKILLTLSILLLSIFLFSCTSIPTMNSLVPPDPTYSEPTIWGTNTPIYLSIDKRPSLLPLSMPDYVQVKVSIPSISEDLTADNFKLFENGKAQGFVLSKESSSRKDIDIAFIMDTTGSMYNAIDGVKSSVTSFIATLTEAGYNVKIAIIPYDDAAPSKEISIEPTWLDLSDSASASQFVDKLYANGGNDGPENPYAGIMYAWENCSWRPSSQRIIVLITDANAHYKSEPNPGDAAGYALYDKEDLVKAIQGYATIHGVFVPGYYYNTSDTDFSSPDDPRELCMNTGGLIEYTDSSGNVDLNALGISDYVESSWILTFESDSPNSTNTIKLYFKSGEHEGHAEKIMSY